MIGTRVGKENKIRKDIFYSQSESLELDNYIFSKIETIVDDKYKIKLKYRETYKLGTYYGDDKGFYIPHTDTQGRMNHRKISIVICLSPVDNYEGGVFNFIELKKGFQFDIGDTIIFKSSLLHGVEPVTNGKRQVLISFMWDDDGEKIRYDNNSNINNSRYLPNNNIKNAIENEKLITNELQNIVYDYDTFNSYHDKIISYSLWGDSEIYNYGIVENALVAKKELPDFKIYVYFNNTILIKILNILKRLDNVVLILINNIEKSAINSLWRFKPCFNSNSLVYVRDSDSLINKRDIFVMTDFISSKQEICSVKDNIAHCAYAILAGMWGCKNGILNKYLPYFNNFSNNKLNVRGIDQHLLIKIYYENIDNIQLYISQNIDKNQFYEVNIKHLTDRSPHIGSYNYWTPLTCAILKEDNKKLTTKRYYSFGNQSHLNAFKVITLIPVDSGPGNQIIGIKECLILSNLLTKICIIPPIREHYLKSNTIFYNFNDIFNLNLNNIIIDSEKSDILNRIDNSKRYCIHGNCANKKLRHEQIINSKTNNEILLNHRLIKTNNCVNELKNINDNLIIIKHLFNNVYISKSGVNGDFNSGLNPEFKNIYADICSKWDFSDYIKLIGNQYIETTFKNSNFISVHIRMPDIMSGDISKYTNNEYTDEKILEVVSKIKTENNIPIFIASNNIDYLKKIGIIANFINIHDKYNSFIEQYICCTSETFYYLNLENTRFKSVNNRSTWTSFVIDYRTFLNKLNNNYNLINQ